MIIYDEPADAYHANPAIGSGDIRAFIRSPVLYHDMQNGLTPRETAAMKFGSTAHLAMLEPDLFASLVVIKPEDVNFSTKEGKAWRAANGTGKIIVPYKDSGRLTAMRARMPDEVRRILSRSKCEVTVRNELDGIPIQCRVDAWDLKGGAKYDLKTVAAMETVERDIWKRGYHIQDRWYSLVLGNEPDAPKATLSALIFAETNPPFRWRIVSLDAEYRMIADDAIDKAWLELLDRRKSGDWSDREELHLLASPPAWMADDEDDTDEEDAA